MTLPEEVQERRRKVIELLSHGLTEREIARQLDVSEPTIWRDVKELKSDPEWFKNYLSNLFTRILNEMDLANAGDRRCVFTNVCRLMGKMMPENIKLEGLAPLIVKMWKPEENAVTKSSDNQVSTTPETAAVPQ
jgi:hypothetical protein